MQAHDIVATPSLFEKELGSWTKRHGVQAKGML